MSEPAYVHIVDHDPARRAQIARQLYDNRIHAEIYESLDELTSCPPKSGAVLVSDEGSTADLAQVISAIQLKAGFLPVALFSSEPSPRKIVQAMANGALDYLEWPCSRDELLETVRRISDLGERKARAERQKAEARRQVEKLTARETEVLKLLVNGASNKAAAQELGISPRTVEIHRSNMMAALNARSAADAVRIGIYAGLDS